MVAVINTSKNLRQVLNYNEKKVQRNVAQLIHAENFLAEKNHLNFHEKILRLKKLNDLNGRSKVNTLHVSLNFHPSEKINSETMIELAKEYMQGIGFGDQPYLVYEHKDAGHPHLHVVSSLIKENGKRISTQNLGRNQSEKIRKVLEKKYKLVNAKNQNKSLVPPIKPIATTKVIYGKSEIKNAIQNVLSHVTSEYKFTSVPELNAILRLYNVRANPGAKNSRISNMQGMVYHALDSDGKTVGVPIKASDFYFKPTLKNLQKKFEVNEVSRAKNIGHIKSKIDWVILNKPRTIEEFQKELRRENIELVIRQNVEGIIYGFTYVDFNMKTILNGSDLGKAYSANGIIQKFENVLQKNQNIPRLKEMPEIGRHKSSDSFQTIPTVPSTLEQHPDKILAELLKPEIQNDDLPYELKRRKKRKMKR